MFGLSPTTSSPSGVPLSLYQARLQQARMEAAQAQDKVRSLEAQTAKAQREADQAKDDVRSLERQAPRPQTRLNTLGQQTGRLLNQLA